MVFILVTNSNLSPPAPIILPSTLRLSLSNGRPQRVIPSFLPQTSPCTTHHSAKQRYVNEITETIGGSPRPSPAVCAGFGRGRGGRPLIPQVGRRSGGGGPFLDPDCFSHLLKVKATKAAAACTRGEGRRRRRRRKPRWRRKMEEKENTTYATTRRAVVMSAERCRLTSYAQNCRACGSTKGESRTFSDSQPCCRHSSRAGRGKGAVGRSNKFPIFSFLNSSLFAALPTVVHTA